MPEKEALISYTSGGAWVTFSKAQHLSVCMYSKHLVLLLCSKKSSETVTSKQDKRMEKAEHIDGCRQMPCADLEIPLLTPFSHTVEGSCRLSLLD